MRHIIQITLKEIFNKRLLHLGVMLTILYLIIYGLGIHYIVKNDVGEGIQFWYMQELGYQFLTLGWYISTFLSGALAIMMGAGSIAHEIESGTILGLASRSLRRGDILGGKFIGYSLVTALYTGVLVTAIAIIVRCSFRLIIDPAGLMTGIILFMLFPVVLVAVAHLVSTLLNTLGTAVAAFMLFTVAIIGGFIEQIGAMISNTAMVNIGVISSLLMPTDAIYRMAVSQAAGILGQGAIMNFGPFGASSTPSIWMLLYALVYIAVMFVLAIYYFGKRDL